MDPQIHGALVGGTIGGLTAALAVGLDRWAQGRTRVRLRLFDATDRLERRARAAGRSGVVTSTEAFYVLFDDAQADIAGIERLRGVLWLRRSTIVRAALTELESVWFALGTRRVHDSDLVELSTGERSILRVATRSVHTAVHGQLSSFPATSAVTDRFNKWVATGLEVGDLRPLPRTTRDVVAYRWRAWRTRRDQRRALSADATVAPDD